MSSFTLTNTAGDIDSAISRVVGADATPTAASQNMVTSSGIKSALENLATSNTFTVNSFAPSSIDKLADGLGALDSTLPTSAAVKNYVDNSSANSAPFNSLRLYLLPNDFDQSSTASVTYGKNSQPTFGSGTPSFVTASTRIPLGYKATQFTYSTDTTNNTILTVFQDSISSGSSSQKGTKTAKGSGLVLNISDVTGSDTNYVSVHLGRDNLNTGSNRYYYGGYFTLVQI